LGDPLRPIYIFGIILPYRSLDKLDMKILQNQDRKQLNMITKLSQNFPQNMYPTKHRSDAYSK
jgi:hypothetical protein